MDPDSKNMNLPPPVNEMPIAIGEQATAGPELAEQLPARPEAASAPQPLTASSAADDVQAALASTLGTDAPIGSAATSGLPDDVADEGPIEKVWVLKAKQIVQRTRENPYEQNRQLATMRADYLQKRYGKVIKLAE